MILNPEKSTRVNDRFVSDESIICVAPPANVSHPIVDSPPNSKDSRFQAHFYKKIALDIVTETVFKYPYPYISEKTLRPIACKRMFIVVGPAHLLKLLHIKGFQTFGDFLDESYDDIICPTTRFHAVTKSIKNFIDRPLDEIKEFYLINQKRFDHNFQTLRNLRSKELVALKSRIKQM